MAQKWAWEEEKVITSVTALPGHRLRIMLRTGSVRRSPQTGSGCCLEKG